MGWSIKHCQICLTPETVIRRPKATRSFGKMGLFRGLEWKIFVKMEESFHLPCNMYQNVQLKVVHFRLIQ